MGHITGPFGVKGWVKIQPLTETPDSLLDYPVWWIGGKEGWQQAEVERAQVQSTTIAAKLSGCNDREQAATYRGREVAIARAEFPAAGENEFYWADLVGLQVVNEQGEDLGLVTRVFETGANDVLVVQGSRERLIPFIEQVVRAVDLAGRVIRVDWGADY